MERTATTPQTATPSRSIATYYLLLYNVIMTAGWSIILYKLADACLLANKQPEAADIYAAVHLPLKIFQTAALLEVLHAATRLIRAPVSTTLLQVSSRLMLVWGVTEPVPHTRVTLSFITMVLAWSLTEIPRYFYFSVSALTADVPYWLVYTRYSTFLPLYPMGAGSEWLTLYAALSDIQKTSLFSIALPNRFNAAFDYYIFCIVVLAMYIPGLPYMYSHMMRQRRKYVTPTPDKKSTQKTE